MSLKRRQPFEMVGDCPSIDVDIRIPDLPICDIPKITASLADPYAFEIYMPELGLAPDCPPLELSTNVTRKDAGDFDVSVRHIDAKDEDTEDPCQLNYEFNFDVPCIPFELHSFGEDDDALTGNVNIVHLNKDEASISYKPSLKKLKDNNDDDCVLGIGDLGLELELPCIPFTPKAKASEFATATLNAEAETPELRYRATLVKGDDDCELGIDIELELDLAPGQWPEYPEYNNAVIARITGGDGNLGYLVDLFENGLGEPKTGAGFLSLPEICVNALTHLPIGSTVLAHRIQVAVTGGA